jgi:hypothetical protein
VIAFHNPFARPLHQLGLELVFLVAAALTLRHAVRDRRSLFQWLAAFCYGLWMELIAFNFLDNYWHAKFTVQLYRDQLPLYVIALYPTFHYTGVKLAERFKAPLAVEALLAGFIPCLMDVAFDMTGVGAGWWSWSTKDPTIATRWLDVPVTSFYWYLLFGPAYALGCRGAWRISKSRAVYALAPLAGLFTIVGGTLFFLPFNGLHALGVPDDAPVIAQLFLCAGAAIVFAPREPLAADRSLLAVPFLLVAYFTLVMVLVAPPSLGERAVCAVFAATGLLFIVYPKEAPWTLASRSRPIRPVGSPSDSRTSSPPTRS